MIQTLKNISWVGAKTFNVIRKRNFMYNMATEANLNKNVLVIFDFDLTMITVNTDPFVFEQLAPHLLEQMDNISLQEKSWDKVMTQMLGKLLEEKFSATAILECVEKSPLPEPVKSIVTEARNKNMEVLIVSNGNSLFLERVLNKNDMIHHFSKIYTNPSKIVDEKIEVSPYHIHECLECPPNLCKGTVVSSIIDGKSFDRVVYVGDGRGDFCATTKLRPNDLVFAREDYPLDTLLQNNPIQAHIRKWNTHKSLEDLFKEEVFSKL